MSEALGSPDLTKAGMGAPPSTLTQQALPLNGPAGVAGGEASCGGSLAGLATADSPKPSHTQAVSLNSAVTFL